MADKFADARETLEFARAKAYQLRPYWQHALYAWPLHLDLRVPSMACDRQGRIYSNPMWLLKYGRDVGATGLCHESWHLLAGHYERADALGVTPERAALANRCQDAENNDGLQEEWLREKGMVPLPREWCILPEDVGGNPHEAWERYYLDLLSNPPPPSQGQKEQNCGSGAHGHPQEWEIGGVPSDEEATNHNRGLHESQIQTIREEVAKDTLRHANSRGHVPSHLIEWSQKVLRPKPIPWDRLLDGLVRNALQLSRGYRHYSYMRPSRRGSGGDVILAALRSPIPKITLVGDTSGSMSSDQLALIRGTISDVCSSLGAVLTFLPVDAAVHGEQRNVADGALAQMVGRGGTDMTVGIQHAVEKTSPDAIVVATDCATPWPAEKPRVPVIVAAVEAPESCIQEVPAWAKVVRVERVER